MPLLASPYSSFFFLHVSPELISPQLPAFSPIAFDAGYTFAAFILVLSRFDRQSCQVIVSRPLERQNILSISLTLSLSIFSSVCLVSPTLQMLLFFFSCLHLPFPPLSRSDAHDLAHLLRFSHRLNSAFSFSSLQVPSLESFVAHLRTRKALFTATP